MDKLNALFAARGCGFFAFNFGGIIRIEMTAPHGVPLTGPEVVTGSTRMKAGTATKLVLNTISTGAMIRMGRAYGNLMVDLLALSAKLVDRGERIVMEACGVSRERARAAIEAADRSVKLAIVMVRAGLGHDEARARLEAAGGFVRRAVGDPPAVTPAP